MKMFKKMLSFVLVLAILFPGILTVNAAQAIFPISLRERLLLIDALSDIKPQKDLWGLKDVDFNSLNIGEPIQTYNYVEGEFERSHDMYPLTIDDRLVLWAIPINGQFQITNSLVSEINASIDFGTPFALVYDTNNAYLYSNQSFSLLKHFYTENKYRSTINTNTRFAIQNIDTVSLSQNTPLAYDDNQNIHRLTPSNVSCSVSYVSQLPNQYSNLCWAASVACIVNYIKGRSYTAVDIAQAYYGSYNFDRGIGADNLTERIRDYGLEYYQFSNLGDFDNQILGSIQANNPVGGVFDVIGGNAHSTVIYGINVIAGRIQVMDPEFGMTTATSNSAGNYVYVSSYSGSTLELYAISYDTGN